MNPKKTGNIDKSKPISELAARKLTPIPILSDAYPSHSRFAESYRTLRTNIHFAFMEEDFSTLLVTSASELEGKTTTVMNLAYIMAQTGKSVLMMDGDLRRPGLSRLLPTNSSRGLSGLLSNVLGTEVDSGSLGEIPVTDLFRLLSFQKKSGVLHLREGEERLDIHFRNGEMADVRWLTRPKDRRLASLLVRNQKLTREQAEQALARKRNTGQKLGYVLLNMGLMNEAELSGFITLHIMEGLRMAVHFRSGQFSFKRVPETEWERGGFNPADPEKIYHQALIGEEELPYIDRCIRESIVKAAAENLYLLPCGALPPQPAELLGSKRMAFLLSHLKRQFDVIIIDSPPVLPASDALNIAPRTDGVLLVVKAGQGNRDMIKKAAEQIQLSRANLIGVVLNQVDVKREGYYKYYYKYRYGYSEGKRKRKE